jgi:DNA-binding response OmpR family regulator
MPKLVEDAATSLTISERIPLERHPRVLVAHRRAPIQRMIRTNLEADGLAVATASAQGACLTALRNGDIDVLVLDAELVRDDGGDGSTLLRYLLRARIPILLLSWDPSDRLLARTLHDAPFVSRPDNIDLVTTWVQRLSDAPVRV